jgi:two-component system, NarL family, invasion response regulator UvrY
MSKLNIALVDDHVMLRNGLANLITNMNDYNVIFQSDNGLEFVKEVGNNSYEPDIVLLDVNMPQMDGYETAKWIRSNLPFTKVLVLSMFDDEKSIIKMLRYGAKGYILKDGDPEQLAAALYDVVHKGYHYTDLVNGKLIHAISKLDEDDFNNTENKFTAREIELLKLCCSEMTYKEIANIMCVSVRTVEGYRDSLFEKLDLKTRVGLVLYAIKSKIFEI